MKLHLLAFSLLLVAGAQLNAGYLTDSKIAQSLVPAALVAMGLKAPCNYTLGAGLAGLGLVGVRYAAQKYGCTCTYNVPVTKGLQVALPLALAYCLHTAAAQQDAAYAAAVAQAEQDGTDLDPSIKNGDFQRNIRNMFLGLTAAEAVIQTLC